MTEIIMPKMGLNMSEGLIVEWLAKTGDEIVQGQGIASIEYEKVVNNIEAEADGILHIAVEAGETVPVAGVIGYLLAAGEQAPVDTGERTGGQDAESAQAATQVGPEAKPSLPAGGKAQSEVRVSPVARRKAQQLGVDLSGLYGSGPGGRITIEDVEKAAAGHADASVPTSRAAGKRVPFTGVRKAIASAMSTSQRDAAEVTLTSEVDCSRLVQARDSGAGKTKVSYNAMLIQLAAAGLKRFPYMNVRLEDEAIVQLEEINVGLAMEAEQGLVVPVVQGADRLSVEQIQEKIQDLKIVVEHMGKPPIASGIFEPWAEDLAAIAKNPTVYCKISELVTQANWENWSSEASKPYVQHAPECLGRQRLMWGSGWPVCLLATDFERTLMSSIEALGPLSKSELDCIFNRTARSFYDLD